MEVYYDYKPHNKRCYIYEIDEAIKNLGDDAIIFGDKPTLLKRWKKRYYRLAKMSVRKEEVNKYLSNPIEYKLPVKA